MTTSILAIDPGPLQSGVALMDFNPDRRALPYGVVNNANLLAHLWDGSLATDYFAIEQIRSYGLAVGATTFDTVEWGGRFMEAWLTRADLPESRILRIPRLWIKTHLCHSARAKDANVRQALIDRFGPQGTKKNPGPTFGFSSHTWRALAVGAVAKDLVAGVGWIAEQCTKERSE